MYFTWKNGHTRILSYKVKPRGLNHKGQRPMFAYITFTEVAKMVQSSRSTSEFVSKLTVITTALHPDGKIIPVYL